MDINLLGNRVLITPDKITKTHLGIHLPVGTSKTNTGTVEYIGPDVKELKAGDRVYFEGGSKIEVEGKEYLMFFEPDLMAVCGD